VTVRPARARRSGRARAVLLSGLTVLLGAPPGASAHDWYTELRRPDGKGSCCSDRDCRPVEQCTLPSGKDGLSIEGRCVSIPRDKVLPVASPDGRSHACWNYLNGVPRILCVILGGQT
jgi:hypothetical protein